MKVRWFELRPVVSQIRPKSGNCFFIVEFCALKNKQFLGRRLLEYQPHWISNPQRAELPD